MEGQFVPPEPKLVRVNRGFGKLGVKLKFKSLREANPRETRFGKLKVREIKIPL